MILRDLATSGTGPECETLDKNILNKGVEILRGGTPDRKPWIRCNGFAARDGRNTKQRCKFGVLRCFEVFICMCVYV